MIKFCDEKIIVVCCDKDFSHQNTALRLLFCVPNVVYFYEHETSIIKHLSLHSTKSEFGNKEKAES